MSSKKIIYLVLVFIVILIACYFIWSGFFNSQNPINNNQVACTMEAKICPDGSAVGRVGPNCEFSSCPEVGQVDKPIVDSPKPNEKISSPLVVSGRARGNWFFEASFPIQLVDANNNVIAQAVAQAKGDWMTTNLVPFSAELKFNKPVSQNTGYLILKKDNPSGLPEHDDELKIPIIY